MTEEKRQLILICGIPGMGKTTIGDFLESNSGFKHFDFEKKDPIPPSDQWPNKSIFTWGFIPDNSEHLDAIQSLINCGCKMIWFDGNRAAAKIAYMKREAGNESARNNAFVTQVNKINETKIKNAFPMVEINTFHENGTFKDKIDIIQEINR